MEGESTANEEQLRGVETREEGNANQVKMGASNRKEKRKAVKKLKRKQSRKEIAIQEREQEEARMNDPEEQRRLTIMEEEEARSRERELKEFEERERAWMLAAELKRKKEEEEREEENRRKDLEESRQQEVEEEKKCSSDDEWEYVEEGPAEIIFKGNEIIFRKKKVRVPKTGANQQSDKEDTERPTSNPLPPQSEAFADYQSAASAQQMLENVAQQVPFFGTEQDKSHCPFHLKTGACRFGQRCSRVHFYPDKSCTLLIKNMYNGPGMAWDQDEGLEVRKCYLHVILRFMDPILWKLMILALVRWR